MPEKTYTFVECSGCFREEKCDEASLSGRAIYPHNWVKVVSYENNKTVFDFCNLCFSEMVKYFFDNKRQDKKLEEFRARLADEKQQKQKHITSG